MNIIHGDLLNCTDPVIAHQMNCLCIRPHGLAASIAAKYPYANVYGERKPLDYRNMSISQDQGVPGTIVVRKPWFESGPIVVGLYGQYDFGKPGRNRVPLLQDNQNLRIYWFEQCLARLHEYMCNEGHASVGFPYLIGCNLAGGNWAIYERLLNEFAERASYTVNVYKL